MTTTNLQDILRILHPFPFPVSECKGCPWNLLRYPTILTDRSHRTIKRITCLKEEIDRLYIGASILVSMEIRWRSYLA